MTGVIFAVGGSIFVEWYKGFAHRERGRKRLAAAMDKYIWAAEWGVTNTLGLPEQTEKRLIWRQLPILRAIALYEHAMDRAEIDDIELLEMLSTIRDSANFIR